MTISRGHRGVKIFTANKIQLRQNIAHSGHRTLAMDMKPSAFQKLAAMWGRDVAFVLNVQQSRRKTGERQAEMMRQAGALRRGELERQAEAFRQAEALRQEESERQSQAERQREAARQAQPAKQTESVKPTETVERKIQKTQTIRKRIEMARRQANQNKQSGGMRI